MKFRLGDKISIWVLGCGILASYTGVYLLQNQVHDLYAAAENDYVISTIINPVLVENTGTVSIMHFFSNQTDETSHDLVIASVLPNTVDVVSANSPIISTESDGNTMIYYFNSTSSEDTIIIDVQAQDGEYGLFKNIATIGVDGGDPFMDNNTYESSFIALSDINAEIDLAVASQAVNAPDGTDGGDTVTLEFRIQNNGPTTAYGAIVSYQLDPSLIVSDTSGDPIIQEANIVQWSIDELPVGDYIDFTITANILSTVIDEEQLDSYISVSSPMVDIDENNNTASTNFTVYSDNRAIQLSMIADDTEMCLDQSNHVLITYANDDTNDQTLRLQLNKLSSVAMEHFAPSADTENSSIYQRNSTSISGGSNGFISFDITPTTIGIKTLIVEAFDTEDEVRDSVTLSIEVDDCTTEDPDDEDDEEEDEDDDEDDEDEDTETLTGKEYGSREYAQPTSKKSAAQIQHFAALAQDINADGYTCAEEIAPAYAYAYEKGLTTMKTLQGFRPCDKILRIELAKILANYAVNVLGKKPDDSRVCVFDDMQAENKENKFYAELICKLGIMGLRSNGEPDTIFNPYRTVTRAQLSAGLSRQIYGTKYNTDNETYWFLDHLMALRRDDIIKYIDNPNMEELRSFVAIMLMRIDLFDIVQPLEENK